MIARGKSGIALLVIALITACLVVVSSPVILPVEADGPLPPQPQVSPVRQPPREPPPVIDGHGTGFNPPEMDLSHLTGQEMPERFMVGESPVGAPPTIFDWRTYGAGSNVTPVKNQSTCGACYAFAAIANIESEMLIDGAATLPNPDYSENNAKECNWRELNNYNDGTYDWGSCDGGNYWMLASLFSQKGVVLESCDPYIAGNVTCNSSCPYQKTLLDWRIICGGVVPDTNVLKTYIYNQASPVYTTVYVGAGPGDTWYDTFAAYDGSGTMYYPSCTYNTNHAVLIVGWDDSRTHGGGTGAWIVKNSWGTAWGAGGYFYIAYGSANIGMHSSYMDQWQDYDSSGGIMYYDDDYPTGAWGYTNSTTAWGLCKFIPTSNSYATRVEFWTSDVTTDVGVGLYDTFDGTNVGSLLWSSLNHSFSEAGYHGVDVSPPVPISNGDNITAVVKFTNNSYKWPIQEDHHGTIETGRTYISNNGTGGTWYDVGVGSVHPSDVAIRLRYSNAIDLEYGDAPDGTYPSLLASDGVRHLPTDTEWLGLQSTGDGKDYEPDANVPDLDLFDDGLLTSTITAGKATETVTFEVTDFLSSPLYINILIDLNRDGDWSVADNEHVVVNQVAPTGPGEWVLASNQFNNTGASTGWSWLRMTLTRIPINTPWNGTMTGSGTGLEWFEYGETEDWPIYILPEGGGIPISGTTYAVNCTHLSGVKVELFDGAISLGSDTSSGSGSYNLTAPAAGTYNVTASKDEFRDETQQRVVGTEPVTLDFCGNTGLIPDAPGTPYLVTCIHYWLHPELGCELGTPKLVSVIHAWLHHV